ncbi:MAG TPA: type II toxin-antitoxin system RelE/ParE family toxin [Burkholderiaceae bacterium]|nr:type II toxin-antitoxin system RelE/ParE family toxin [Burkholderiaceae bacterium]
MRFAVRLTTAAIEDLQRLYEHLLDRATTADDLDLANLARAAILASLRRLESEPFPYRKAGGSAFLRELLVPFSGSGHVVLYEIVDSERVDVLAVRHQREDDYH